jgi:MFS transporter, DHA1 family, tetracycline resistance protein
VDEKSSHQDDTTMSISFSSTSKNLTPITDRGNSRSPFLLPNPVRTMMGEHCKNDRGDDDAAPTDSTQHHQHLYVLPVLLLEFLALALTRAVLPALLLHEYGNRVYLVMGAADFVRGLLAFFTCPVFGKLSDLIGRRTCLFVTVLGTCAPVCSLALFSWDGRSTMVDHVGAEDAAMFEDTAGGDTLYLEPSASAATVAATYDDDDGQPRHHTAITVFIILFALSGVFSSTFTLVFAYISDTVQNQEERVSAYGLALATFGLSFTLGPIIGTFWTGGSR